MRCEMIIVKIEDWMKEEAKNYAEESHDYTSRGHDFHDGGADEASKYMYLGKLGEKAFKKLLLDNGITFIEDYTGPDQADEYDFLVKGYKIDVKTRTKSYHTRTLEMVTQFRERPKDVYVGTYYNAGKDQMEFYGYIRAEELEQLHSPENHGYGWNYFAYDREMHPVNKLLDDLKKVKPKTED